jgi:hypothetical protein
MKYARFQSKKFSFHKKVITFRPQKTDFQKTFCCSQQIVGDFVSELKFRYPKSHPNPQAVHFRFPGSKHQSDTPSINIIKLCQKHF